jgi:hypothetical protein
MGMRAPAGPKGIFSFRCLRILAATLTTSLSLAGLATTPAFATDDVLILGPTLGGPTSPEYLIVTSTGAVPGFPSVTGLGLTAHIATTSADWVAQLSATPRYKAIVMGDPGCVGSPTVPLAWTTTTTAALKAVATGNTVVIGTDPVIHPGAGGTRGIQLLRSAINFAVSGFTADGTGSVIVLSCYYGGAPAGTPVPVLDAFSSTPNTFKVQGGIPCTGDVAIVASSPALTGLTGGPGGTLSAWGCSVHEGFNNWDASFIPLAIAIDVPAALKTYPAADPKGFPYILARGRDLVVTTEDTGILKICKVAGTGITVGTSFTFTAGSSTVTVPAGPAPGGTCMVGPSFPVGTSVTVTEMIPAGDTVSSISVAPPGQLLGTPNLAGGSVNVAIGSGVTEVTFTDNRTGFIEICKKGDVTGTFNFTVSPGGLGPFAVPAGACSPAIAVAAGPVTIHELPSRGGSMVACSSLPASQQGPCNITTQTSTVTVVPGDVSTMTIAFVTNRRVSFPPGDLGAATPTHTHASGATTVAIGCTPNPASASRPVTCTAKVAAVEPKKSTPTGAVSFSEGNTSLGKAQLTGEGNAALTIPTLTPGLHAIIASYDGDADFQQSVSEQSNITVAQQ